MTLELNTVANMDVMDYLRSLPAESVNCVVTSPPYFGLRDYGVDGQIGLERTPVEYVAKIAAVFEEVRRVLRSDGTAWVNLGDSYAADRGGTHMPAQTVAGGISGHSNNKRAWRGQGGATRRAAHRDASLHGLPHKSLIGIPWRVAFALQDAGWILRSEIIWHKLNPMPESVTDRPTKAHEQVFLLAKSPQYWYDADAIAEPVLSGGGGNFSQRYAGAQVNHGGPSNRRAYERRNKRSVWTLTTEPNTEAHFATFPTKLIEPMILAGCPAGGVVLDPFMGSGTTALVARKLGRNFIGCELNPEYHAIIMRRLAAPYTLPLFNEEPMPEPTPEMRALFDED